MKNYEKVLMKIFGGCTGFFFLDLFYQCVIRHRKLSYNSFDNITFILSMLFAVSVFGCVTVIISSWIRSRVAEGKEPISRCYKKSFFISFVPFLMILAMSIYFAITGFRLFSVTYGLQAIHDTFVIFGYYVFGVIVPVLPFCLFWQVLFIVKSITYRSKVVSKKKIIRGAKFAKYQPF